jgi:hypothetical protein
MHAHHVHVCMQEAKTCKDAADAAEAQLAEANATITDLKAQVSVLKHLVPELSRLIAADFCVFFVCRGQTLKICACRCT